MAARARLSNEYTTPRAQHGVGAADRPFDAHLVEHVAGGPRRWNELDVQRRSALSTVTHRGRSIRTRWPARTIAAIAVRANESGASGDAHSMESVPLTKTQALSAGGVIWWKPLREQQLVTRPGQHEDVVSPAGPTPALRR